MSRFICLITIFSFVLLVSESRAQSSESTQDWPVLAKVSAASVGIVSLATTLGGIGTANSDPQTESGESQSNQNDQLFIQELSDELLVLLDDPALKDQLGFRLEDSLEIIGGEYPLLASYYHDILRDHPEFLDQVYTKVDGQSELDKLNKLLLIHLFS